MCHSFLLTFAFNSRYALFWVFCSLYPKCQDSGLRRFSAPCARIPTTPLSYFAKDVVIIENPLATATPLSSFPWTFRSGCAITLALLGVSQEDVARHVGWKSLATAEYYSQCSKVTVSGHTASTLAASTKSAEGSSPQAALLPQTFQTNNELKNWELAFK